MQYTLSQLTSLVKQTFDELFTEFDFWCTGEVARCDARGKYYFLELVEYDAIGNSHAKCKATIFQSSVVESFLQQTKLQLDDLVKQEILFHGRCSFHPQYGFGIIIDEISSTYTAGKMQQSKDVIRETLAKEGIIDRNRVLAISHPPLRLAIITGERSAGYEDFLAILDDAGIIYTVKKYATAVQGNNAKDEVYAALREIYREVVDEARFDLVCLVRGGGDTSGISWQNDIDIARGICHMPIPVMVAIGHTQDSSVLEHVSWRFAKTPSDAAYQIVGLYEEMAMKIDGMVDDIMIRIQKVLEGYHGGIDRTYESVTRLVGERLRWMAGDVERLYASICQYHPDHILARGYAVVRGLDQEGRAMYGDDFRVGEEIQIETSSLNISAIVKGIDEKSPGKQCEKS